MSDLRDDILDRVDIVEVVGRYVDLKPVGRNYMGLSPFKSERTPSFSVSPEKQIFKDFSTGIGGNVITFVMEIEKIDFWDALLLLAEIASIDVQQYRGGGKKGGGSTGSSSPDKHRLYRINSSIATYFTAMLAETATAQDYCATRALTPEIQKRYMIGYAPVAGDALVTFMKKQGYSYADLEPLSIVKGDEQRPYTFFRHRLMFPIANHLGSIVGFAGRSIDPDDTPKYLNTGETPLYDKSSTLYGLDLAKETMRQTDAVMVVEGYMDVIGAYRLFGQDVAVATCGTALTPQHIQRLQRHVRTIYLCFDNDDAGYNATMKALRLCYEQALYPSVMVLEGDQKDIDDLSRADNQTYTFPHALPPSLQIYEGLDYVIMQLQQRYPLDQPQTRQEFLSYYRQIIQHIADYSVVLLAIEKIVPHVHMHASPLLAQFTSYVRRQKRSRYEPASEEDQDAPHTDTVVMGYALLHNDFMHTYIDSETIRVYETFFQHLRTHTDLLHPRIAYDDLQQAQYTREYTLRELGEKKQTDTIARFLERYITFLVKQCIRDQTLDHTVKQQAIHYQQLIAKYHKSGS